MSNIDLNKILDLLSITKIMENDKEIILIYLIYSSIVAFIMFALMEKNKIKNPLYFILTIIIFSGIFIFNIYENKKEMESKNIENGFYENIKNKNITIEHYFSKEEKEIIKSCLEKNYTEINFENCLINLLRDKQKQSVYLETKEKNKDLIKLFNQ